MKRNSFIQMSKLHNVKGRIYHITSPARQENLYATYRTCDSSFWKELAAENQMDFRKSGASGTCIEAREFIIALPEEYTQFEPQTVLKAFTDYFKVRYEVECVSALHHYYAISDLYRKYCKKLEIEQKSSPKARKTYISNCSTQV